MSFTKSLLADSLASTLSLNARRHLREARVSRIPDLATSPDSLRATLLRRGFPTLEPLLDLEERAGGAAFPRGRLLGASCFLSACPSLRPGDLPLLDGEPVFPVYGNPEHLAEWESPFCVMHPSGAIGVFDAPRGPARAYASLDHFLEVEALAPFSAALHVVRVDAFCGEVLAGLVGASPHPPSTAELAAGFVGDDVWVKELRIDLHEGWSSLHGTFLLSEQTDLVVEAMGLLLEQGYSLGHKGPTGEASLDSAQVLSFVDANPELGLRAQVAVAVWGEPGAYVITHRET